MRAWVRIGAGLAALALGQALPVQAVEVDCLVQPRQEVTVSAAIEGVVQDVLVDRGDLVKKGQVVARLESSVERASVSVAKARAESTGRVESGQARLQFASKELARQLRLQQQEVASESEMEEAKSVKDIAEAELLEAREQTKIAEYELQRSRAILGRRTIKSPVNGVVVEKILKEGEYADPPQLMRLAEIDPLRVEVFAPLELYGHIEVGAQVEVRPEQPVGGSHMATVSVVDKVVDAASGTFGVRLDLPNPDYAIPAGLNCRVSFEPGSVARAGSAEADAAVTP